MHFCDVIILRNFADFFANLHKQRGGGGMKDLRKKDLGPKADHGPQTTDHGPRTIDHGKWVDTRGYILWTMDPRSLATEEVQRTTDHNSRTTDHRLLK